LQQAAAEQKNAALFRGHPRAEIAQLEVRTDFALEFFGHDAYHNGALQTKR
jgi:hypothetical protein